MVRNRSPLTVRFGICTAPDQTPVLAEAGYDFVEWPVSRTVGTLDEPGFASLRAQAQSWPISPEAWNVLLPSTLKMVGAEADPTALRSYLDVALPRVSMLGGQVVVLGSGASRTIPDGWPRDRAEAQFDEACRVAGDLAAQHGLTIAIEPLNRRETNLINRVSEAVEVVTRIGHSSVRVLADLFHLGLEDEPWSDIEAAGPFLAHVHVAEPGTRLMPRATVAEDAYLAFFRALQQSGYHQRISIESGPATPDEATAGLRLMRALWERAANEFGA